MESSDANWPQREEDSFGLEDSGKRQRCQERREEGKIAESSSAEPAAYPKSDLLHMIICSCLCRVVCELKSDF